MARSILISQNTKSKIDKNTTTSPTSPQTFQALPDISRPSFPLAAFLWPARASVSQWAVLPLILIFTGLFKWATGLWGYSGFQSPPMHGDFEAQRHWMEITTHLPVSHWYFYDLGWWGLDYPPLTAYHSWLLGKIGSMIDYEWFILDASRALDSPTLKIYMRATVLLSEYIVFIPATVLFLRRLSTFHKSQSHDTSIALVALLMQPGTILIDHAHFQYNTVMLGFVVAALACVLSGRPLWCCLFFVMALGFKQMALYYAPAVFAFLLGSCTLPRINISRLIRIALVTILSFVLLYTPFVLGVLLDIYRDETLHKLPPTPLITTSPTFNHILLQLSQSIHRIFPFSRGLFEDKVANFWCAAHTFYKLTRFPARTLQSLSLTLTLLSILPATVAIGLSPEPTLLPIAFASSAWGFFLFSFQVHEKSVLVPLLPMTLLLGGQGGLRPEKRAWIAWANVLGCWTMFPLLKRDGLRVPYSVLTCLWGWLLGLPGLAWGGSPQGKDRAAEEEERPHPYTRLLHLAFYVIMGVWHILESMVEPPEGKPDLWVVANVLVGAAGFGICWLWCTWGLVGAVWRGREKGRGKRAAEKKKKKKGQ